MRAVLMLGICAFPAVFFYALGSGKQAAAHQASSAVVARVRVARAPSELQLVRSPLPPPVAPKPVSAPGR